MSIARINRESKRQLGQFLTPPLLAKKIVETIKIQNDSKILEPSFGNGSFVFPLVEYLKKAGRRSKDISQQIYGCEKDNKLFSQFTKHISALYDNKYTLTNFHNTDFFKWIPQDKQIDFLDYSTYIKNNWGYFDLIIGNPPFGGTIEYAIQDKLDKIYGYRGYEKIKKETYSFFLVKSFDLLKPKGQMVFICSDTFLTINTMKGLRKLLMDNCDVEIESIPDCFADTNQNMVLLKVIKTGKKSLYIKFKDKIILRENIEKTPNLSWNISDEYTKYFSGDVLGNYIVATSGMTVGNNELFIRKIIDGYIYEPFKFEFFDEPITLENERKKARLNKLSKFQGKKIRQQEINGDTQRNVRWEQVASSKRIKIPDARYCYYNKANNEIVYSKPQWVVFWENDGDAVRTFKKNGNWYLNGIGGQKYFKRSGFTWSLIANKIHTKFLSEGYILDSGSPCAFLRDGIGDDELYFIMAWTLTKRCNEILKQVINHTRNIQGKDVERLPYPSWVDCHDKHLIIKKMKNLINNACLGKRYVFDDLEIREFDNDFEYNEINTHKNKQIDKKVSLFDMPFNMWAR
ncbi:MAG: N-6 DNA methylase [Elusimicrobiota bacterium]